MIILLDDHLVRDVVAGELPADVASVDDELATTNLWLFRLAGALAREGFGGSLSKPVKGLGIEELDRFRRDLLEQMEAFTIVPMANMAWSMADLQERHRLAGRPMSVAMVEALAAAHLLGATIAVARGDVGPGLQAAGEADGIRFHVVDR